MGKGGIMISKTLESAHNIFRKATHIEYLTKPGTQVMSARNIGGPTVDSFINGVNYPNVQSAIDELQTLTMLPINAIYTSDVRVSPEGVRQAEMLTFSGSVLPSEFNKSVITVYGIPFIVDARTNADAVCDIVLTKFEEMRDAGILFYSVQRQSGTTTPIIEVQFIDSAEHGNIESFSSWGIVVQREITVPGKPGYGNWEYMGKESKTLTGGSVTSPFELYYFKRIG